MLHVSRLGGVEVALGFLVLTDIGGIWTISLEEFGVVVFSSIVCIVEVMGSSLVFEVAEGLWTISLEEAGVVVFFA